MSDFSTHLHSFLADRFLKPSGLSSSSASLHVIHPLLHLRAAFILFLAITAYSLDASAQNAWINEFHYDNDGPDTDEFIEIVVERPGSYELGDFSIYLVNGSDGSSYASAAGTAFTEGESAGMYTIYYWAPSSIQNGPDGIALTYGDRLLDFISYEGSFIGTEPPVLDISSTDIGIIEVPSTLQNQSLQRLGSGGQREAFAWTGPAPASPGMINTDQDLRAAPLHILPRPSSATVGDTILVEFVIGTSEFPVQDVVGAGFQIDLDTTLFNLLDLTPGSFFSTDTLTFRRVDKEASTVAYSAATTDSSNAQTGSGTLATLHLQVKDFETEDTTLTFSPYDLLATQQSGTLLHLTPQSDTLTLSLAPLLELSRTSVHLNTVDIATTAVDTFTVSNGGAGTLAVDSMSSPIEGLSADPSTFTLSPGDDQVITLSFQATSVTAFHDDLVIWSNDPDRPEAIVTVEGDVAAVVWPGDTDNNGIVNALDVLPIGQHFDRTGPPRSSNDLTWRAVQTAPWSPVLATYADATGDGLVSQNDIQPIGLNYNRRRATAKSPAPGESHILTIGEYPAGQPLTVDVAVPVDQSFADVLGLGFSLSFPVEVLEVIEVAHYLDVDDATVLAFEHIDRREGRLEVAFTRKRNSGGITASGKLASVRFRTLQGISPDVAITLYTAALSSLDRVDSSPAINLESDAAAPSAIPAAFRLQGNYPNPFNNATTVLVDVPERAAIDMVVYDMLGRAVLRVPTRTVEPGYGQRIPLRMRELSSGTYFYRLSAVSREESFQDVGSFTLLK